MRYGQLIKIKMLAAETIKSQEADALTRAIRRDEIPKEYKHMRLINRGNTSIILEKDPETVIMLTRDDMKKDWLHFGLRISKNFQVHDIPAKDRKFKEFNIFAIELPKLFQLDPQKKKVVREELKFFDKACDLLHGELRAKQNLDKLMYYYEEHKKENSILYKLFEFLINYYPKQWHWDLALRQFAQDKSGNIILVDPIVSRELVERMHLSKNTDEMELRLLYNRKNA